MWKDREGKEVSGKEFIERWKAGISRVTPLQQVNTQLLFSLITVLGLLCGIIVSIWKISSLWWLGIILIAGLGNTIAGMIGIYQRKMHLERVNRMIKESIEQDHKEVYNV